MGETGNKAKIYGHLTPRVEPKDKGGYSKSLGTMHYVLYQPDWFFFLLVYIQDSLHYKQGM